MKTDVFTRTFLGFAASGIVLTFAGLLGMLIIEAATKLGLLVTVTIILGLPIVLVFFYWVGGFFSD